MRKLVALLCLTVLLAAPLAPASARDYGYGRGGMAWRGAGGGQFSEMMVADREGRGNPGRVGRAERGAPPPRVDPRGRMPQMREPQIREPQAPVPRQFSYAIPETRGAYRRGDYLPDTYRNSPVPDPGRFHLRTPPYGYSWVQVGPDMMLMQESTGRILDSVPGTDVPPPRYRRR